MMNQGYIAVMNNSIKNLIKKAIKVSIKKPIIGKAILELTSKQKELEKRRTKLNGDGYNIPPFLIASITNRCNLMCKGCYAHANSKVHTQELSDEMWLDIFSQASDAGVSFILLAGGEPFVRLEVLRQAGKTDRVIFPIFTNGTYLNEEALLVLMGHRNLLPIISIEGFQKETDERRGEGIYESTLKNMKVLKEKHIFFGTSITVTRENYATVTTDGFVKSLIDEGCLIFFYVEYVPVDGNSDESEITQHQREKLIGVLAKHRNTFDGLFLSFPGDEQKFGGCLSSGKGFAHINASGDLEPCPFSPYSDVNLKTVALKEALQSKFLTAIRESGEELKETEHGCALFNKRDWVQSLLKG